MVSRGDMRVASLYKVRIAPPPPNKMQMNLEFTLGLVGHHRQKMVVFAPFTLPTCLGIGTSRQLANSFSFPSGILPFNRAGARAFFQTTEGYCM